MDTLVHLDASKAGYTEKILQYPEPGINSRMLASLIIVSSVCSIQYIFMEIFLYGCICIKICIYKIFETGF